VQLGEVSRGSRRGVARKFRNLGAGVGGKPQDARVQFAGGVALPAVIASLLEWRQFRIFGHSRQVHSKRYCPISLLRM